MAPNRVPQSGNGRAGGRAVAGSNPVSPMRSAWKARITAQRCNARGASRGAIRVRDREVEGSRCRAVSDNLRPPGHLHPAVVPCLRYVKPPACSVALLAGPSRSKRRAGKAGLLAVERCEERLGADPAGRCPRLVTSGRGSTRLRDARSSSRSGTRPGPAGDARISPTAGAGGCPSTAAARAGSDCAARRRSAGRGPLQVPFDDVVRGTSRIGPSGDRREEGPTPERPEVDIV